MFEKSSRNSASVAVPRRLSGLLMSSGAKARKLCPRLIKVLTPSKIEDPPGPNPIRFGGPGKNRFKRGHDVRVELTFNRLCKTQTGHAAGHRVTVRPIRGHRVVGVRH